MNLEGNRLLISSSTFDKVDILWHMCIAWDLMDDLSIYGAVKCSSLKNSVELLGPFVQALILYCPSVFWAEK